MNGLPSRGARATPKPVRKRLIAFYVLAFAAAGGWMGYGVLDGWHWQDVEHNWESTGGTIEAAYVHEILSHRRIRWETGWIYSYSVNGRKYDAESNALNRAYSAHLFISERQAEHDKETRPIGSRVPVHYDPAAPQRSVLDPATDSPLDWFALGLSGISICAAILSAAMLVKTIKKPKPDA
jgi:hypothetical protein